MHSRLTLSRADLDRFMLAILGLFADGELLLCSDPEDPGCGIALGIGDICGVVARDDSRLD